MAMDDACGLVEVIDCLIFPNNEGRFYGNWNGFDGARRWLVCTDFNKMIDFR